MPAARGAAALLEQLLWRDGPADRWPGPGLLDRSLGGAKVGRVAVCSAFLGEGEHEAGEEGHEPATSEGEQGHLSTEPEPGHEHPEPADEPPAQLLVPVPEDLVNRFSAEVGACFSAANASVGLGQLAIKANQKLAKESRELAVALRRLGAVDRIPSDEAKAQEAAVAAAKGGGGTRATRARLRMEAEKRVVDGIAPTPPWLRGKLKAAERAAELAQTAADEATAAAKAISRADLWTDRAAKAVGPQSSVEEAWRRSRQKALLTPEFMGSLEAVRGLPTLRTPWSGSAPQPPGLICREMCDKGRG